MFPWFLLSFFFFFFLVVASAAFVIEVKQNSFYEFMFLFSSTYINVKLIKQVLCLWNYWSLFSSGLTDVQSDRTSSEGFP